MEVPLRCSADLKGMMEGCVNFLAVWLPEGKVCSYNIPFTDTSSSVEQIYLTQ